MLKYTSLKERRNMLKKPFIATRELVVFPGVVTPIFIGRQASLSSLEEACKMVM